MADLYWPFDPSTINYGFGYPPGYGGFHNGIDFPVKQGTELRATVSGTVRNNDAGQVDGAGVDIATADGWTVRMWHVSKFLVPNGSKVNAGDVVALSGGTPGTWGAGNATGPHLHWGVAIGRKGNDYNWVDPASLNPKRFGNIVSGADEDMKLILSDPAQGGDGSIALVGEFTFTPVGNMDQVNAFAKPFGGYVAVTREEYLFNQEQVAVRRNQFSSSFQINVGALAQAIADKIDCGGTVTPCVTTKADILESIEANYPEDK